MRAPFQILVIPFHRRETGAEFAVLKRSDAGWWQLEIGEIGDRIIVIPASCPTCPHPPGRLQAHRAVEALFQPFEKAALGAGSSC